MRLKTTKILQRVVLTSIAGSFFFFAACTTDSPLNPVEESQNQASLAKPSKVTIDVLERASEELLVSAPTLLEELTSSDAFPQYAYGTVSFDAKKGQYDKLSFGYASGTSFSIVKGALIPPDDFPFGDPVTITMQIDKDPVNNELIYTFGPHGSQFDPPAMITLDYKYLETDVDISEIPTLYYIEENGDYIEQTPDYIDVSGKKVTIYAPHFSRYAIAHTR
ncbi:MAG: hypothetical protein H6696_15355 [Deferribacteres bacterium]|nr:hypothetical protein [candidate division KSB1 bacterium]MCB9503305.1 hypothetical protein [Deferribacteres bacterium]